MRITLYHFVGSFVTKLQSVPLSLQCLHALQNNRLHAIITWQNYESKTYLTTGSDIDPPSPAPWDGDGNGKSRMLTNLFHIPVVCPRVFEYR